MAREKLTTRPFVREEKDELSLYFKLTSIQSRMSIADPEQLILEYTQTMMGFLLFQPKPKRIAMIGLGGGSLAKYCRRKLPECKLTVIEISEEIIALRSKFGIPEESENFQVVCANGANFVRQQDGVLDALLVDGFDSDGQPPELCSVEFYNDCFTALCSGGVLVVNLCFNDHRHTRSVGRIKDAFQGKALTVEAEDGANIIAFAGKGGCFPPSLDDLAKRLQILEPNHPIRLDETAQKILGHTPARRRKRWWWEGK